MTPLTFTIQNIIEKFEQQPCCYLTGDPISIYDVKSYEFDHMIPKSRGGSNTLENLGICTRSANRAKQDMTPDEFIALCSKIANHNKTKAE
jgi:CRISPR/Cas system Type II protein with McrA/HNH and RuvC-like nuclease domain